MTAGSRDDDVALKIALLRARIEALLKIASPEILTNIEFAIERLEKQARPRRTRGRPNRLAPTRRELKLNADLQRLLASGRMTDKEAVERLVRVAQPNVSAEGRRKLIKRDRMRLADVRKKSRK